MNKLTGPVTVIFVTLCFLFPIITEAQNTGNDTDKIRLNIIKQLRLLRDTVNKYPSTVLNDSLVSNLTTIINRIKNFRDPGQLAQLRTYVSNSTNLLISTSDRGRKHTLIQQLNNDLYLKLNYEPDSSLNWQSSANFGKLCDLSVQVFINGVKQAAGTYRLYWLTFLGEEQNDIIRAKKSDGSSNAFTNPYTVSILLPGYITFWLQDANSGVLYKPDFIFKELTPANNSIDINFTKF